MPTAIAISTVEFRLLLLSREHGRQLAPQAGRSILFEISTEYPLSNAVVELHGVLGQKILSQSYSRLESGTQQLRLPTGLASGMYFLRAADAKSFRTAKVPVMGR